MLANFSQRTRNLHASPIREILSVIDRPGMVSFAGGLPAQESFPTIEPGAVPADRLQYGPSEGDPDLRAKVAEDLRGLGLRCAMEQVLILSGSQQGIDLVSKLFVDEGAAVAVESPTYLAALQAFRFFGARFVTFTPGDTHVRLLQRERAALFYTIPTFQNPTGHCYSSDERNALAQACDDAGVTLFEDDPYRDLVYESCDRTPVCARLERASWIYQGSFSKSLAPGLRLGFLVASPDLISYLTRLKQAADLHSNRISQWIVLHMLNDTARVSRLTQLAASYKRKRDLYEKILRRSMDEWATWNIPAGGLFFWLKLKHALDTRPLLSLAIEKGVAFMPGEAFFPDDQSGCGTLRLNFTHACETDAQRGLQILSEMLREQSSKVSLPVGGAA